MTPTQKKNLVTLINALQECNPAAKPDGVAMIARYVDTLLTAEREACAKLANTVSVDLAARIRECEKRGGHGR